MTVGRVACRRKASYRVCQPRLSAGRGTDAGRCGGCEDASEHKPHFGMRSRVFIKGCFHLVCSDFVKNWDSIASILLEFDVYTEALSSVLPLSLPSFASSKVAILKSYGSSNSALGSPSKGSKSTSSESLTANTASSSMYLLLRSKICVTMGLWPAAVSYSTLANTSLGRRDL